MSNIRLILKRRIRTFLLDYLQKLSLSTPLLYYAPLSAGVFKLNPQTIKPSVSSPPPVILKSDIEIEITLTAYATRTHRLLSPKNLLPKPQKHNSSKEKPLSSMPPPLLPLVLIPTPLFLLLRGSRKRFPGTTTIFDGTFYSWGLNSSHEILGERDIYSTPEIFPKFSERSKLSDSDPVVSFGVGSRHTFLVTRSGKLFLFGDAGFGQTGVSPEMVNVSSLQEFRDWRVLTPSWRQWEWAKWVFLGRQDPWSAFYQIFAEILFHFVKI